MGSDETAVRSEPILREVVQRLVSAYAPERIYLFGSTGRGETQPDRAALALGRTKASGRNWRIRAPEYGILEV